MKRCPRIIFAIIAMLCIPVGARAGSGNDRVKVAILADVAAIQPGKSFTLGFKFTIDPGWHIYWMNPGDSGLATTVKLTLPDGFTAGDLQFPVPERLQLPGDIINYGYENEVVLMVRIMPSANLPVDKVVALAAKASFLVCNNVCIPAGQDLSLNLPVAGIAKAANTDVFAQWTQQLPAPPAALGSSGISLVGAAGHKTAEAKMELKSPVRDVQFLPEISDNGQTGPITISTVGNISTAVFPVRDETRLDQVKGLFTFIDANDKRVGFETTVPKNLLPAQ